MSTKGPSQDDNIADFPQAERDDRAFSSIIGTGPSPEELERIEKLEKLKREAYEAHEVLRKKSFMNRMIIILAGGFVFFVFNYLSFQNPEIYNIDKGTLTTINQAVNALILLTIPFVLGCLGAAARILISDITPEHKGGLVVSSGLMAVFSWVSIKSGVLIALIAPHIEKTSLSQETVMSGQSDFYTLALVAIAVGMFSTNIYLMISQKVEQLTLQSKASKP